MNAFPLAPGAVKIKLMTTAEIRTAFLEYFKKQGHTAVESAPVVPQNDPTLLFTNAGMVPFKDAFLGNETRPYTRATSVQKCIRAGGKHNDLENVGFTARHHTFFEMLGNFSFGDYFKKEAIHYAWDFVTNELKLPKDKLYVTVHTSDDEAAEIWQNQEGVPADRISRFDEDNFWSMGETGPCGPCTEIFFDRGPQYEGEKVGDDGDRYMEFWNLVFMQYDRNAKGEMTPLPKPSVDTGAGLERIASILQEVDSNYDIDSFASIIQKIATLSNEKYVLGTPLAASFRVVADHARATTFLIADGVLPSNEGRGYVLRRIIRRAIRHGKKLGFTAPFLHQVAGFVIDQMKDAYPYLIEQRAFIDKAIAAEEEQFFKTLERGLTLLDEETQKHASKKVLPGDVAFKLYDTYGFPIDLTRVICTERGFTVDESGFEKAMERQRSESRKHWKGSGQEAVDETYVKLASDLRTQGKTPEFVGYDQLSATSTCTALAEYADPKGKTGLSLVQKSSGNTVFALFEKTPFYAESGGQAGDRGQVTGKNFKADVVDVQKPSGDLIVAELKIQSGQIQVGETYEQSTHEETRALTARNHTATHLLHWALREVLGPHVKQAGSLVNAELLRFDFTHFQAVTHSEIQQVESLINERIWKSHPVTKQEMNKEDAIAAGAIAFFGEKYGDQVRVVQVGDFSTELCGGTHVDQSSEIHLFKIASEGGIAAGVRRIVAYTSKQAFRYLAEKDEESRAVREKLRATNQTEALSRIEKMAATEKELRKTIEKLQSSQMGGEIDQLIQKAEEVSGTPVILHICQPDDAGIKKLREMSDKIKQKSPQGVVVLGASDTQNKKAFILAATGPKAPKSVQANLLIKELSPLINGRGGGKPDLAQAGGDRPSELSKVLTQARQLIQTQIGNSN